MDIVVTSVVPDPLRGELQREAMVRCLEVLDGMSPWAVTATAKSSADQTDPHVLAIVTLVAFNIECLLAWEVADLVKLGLHPAHSAFLNQLRPPLDEPSKTYFWRSLPGSAMNASWRMVEAELRPEAEQSSFSRHRGQSGSCIMDSSSAKSLGTGLSDF